MEKKNSNILPWLIVIVLAVVLTIMIKDGGITVLPDNSPITDTTTKSDDDISRSVIIEVQQSQQVDAVPATPFTVIEVVTAASQPPPTAEPSPTPVPTPFPRPLTLDDYNWCVENRCGNAGCDGVCE